MNTEAEIIADKDLCRVLCSGWLETATNDIQQ